MYLFLLQFLALSPFKKNVFHGIPLAGKSPNSFQVPVVMKPTLVSLIGHLVACSARISVDRQTDGQNDYCNPRCACAPSVNNTC